MKKRVRSLVLLFLVTTPVFAAGPGILCGGHSSLTVGQWAKYQTDVPLLKTKMESRYAIVATHVPGCVIG